MAAVNLTQSIGGSIQKKFSVQAALRDPILSFSHTFSLKRAHVGGPRPLKAGLRPRMGNPGVYISGCFGKICFKCSVINLSGVLWTANFVNWIGDITENKVNLKILTDCKFYFFLHFFSQYSSALLVMMCIEKFFALYFPLKTRSICTVLTAKWITSITGVILVAFNSQLFFILKVVTSRGHPYCFSNRYKAFLKSDAVLYSYGPFTIMGVTNLAIIYKFIKARIASNSSGTESTNQALSKSALKGTTMLITVCLAFIVLTGAPAIINSITLFPHPMVHLIGISMRYMNNSINGVLYCISGSRFRAELMKTLPFSLCQKRPHPNRLNSTINSAIMSNISSTAWPI